MPKGTFKLIAPLVVISLIAYSPGLSLQETNFEKAIIDTNDLGESQKQKVKTKKFIK